MSDNWNCFGIIGTFVVAFIVAATFGPQIARFWRKHRHD